MSVRRTSILAGIAVVLACIFLYGQIRSIPSEKPAISQSPLPGKSSISGLKVAQDKTGEWTADFDYFFTGEPRNAQFNVEVVTYPGVPESPGVNYASFIRLAERGSHHLIAHIAGPMGARTTRQIQAVLRSGPDGETIVASQTVDQVIDWPDPVTSQRNREIAQSTPQQNLDRAITLIDSEYEANLLAARAILEKLISDNGKFDAAYVELARIAMKTNWGPEGLHQAENLLNSALQIRPDSVNAKVLLGYVYTNQKRFAQADAMFVEASRIKSGNLWLWTNWGELRDFQGKPDQAIQKYREAVTRPITHDTYDRARIAAYRRLIELLRERNDLDAVEALYKQRIAEFGPGSCYSADYARFMLNVRGDPKAAAGLARRALNQNCEDSESRQILGLASYVIWAGSAGAESAAALNEARIFLPAGPTAFYQLARSDLTVGAVRKLVASGEAIDQKDNDKLTALAHALNDKDLDAARRLLKAGARADVPVGEGDVPVALLPVIEDDLEAVRALKRAGIDFSKLRYRGVTALDYAKRTGNEPMLRALGETKVEL